MNDKSCSNCKHSKNITGNYNVVTWSCDMTPFVDRDIQGTALDFAEFHCCLWVDVFEKDTQ